MNALPGTATRNYLLAFAFIAGGYYLLRRFRPELLRRQSSRNVTTGVPQDLKTIPDQVGHYDIDGASFDHEGVVIGGDQTSNKSSAHIPNKNAESDYAPI